MLHVTFGTHKKQSFGAETPERQQHSRASAKQKTVRNMDSERWLLKSRQRQIRKDRNSSKIRAHATSRLKLKKTTSRLKLKETTSRLLGALPL